MVNRKSNSKIKWNRFLKVAGVLIIAGTCFVLVKSILNMSGFYEDSGKPNFIIIFTDDLGYNDVGCFGAKKIETIHLDKMALEGMKLTSFYSQPVCGPARAALLTGCYPDRVNRNGWNVGRIIDLLKKLHLDKNTYVLFTSDNGPWLSKGEMGGSAFPLRGGKGSSWEGGYRVPCILWGPKRIPAGVVSNELMATLDILPTFAALAGEEVPTDRVIDGLDQSNFITGRTKLSERDEFYYYVRGNLHAVRKGKWKLALPDRKKFHSYAGDKTPLIEPELYDLERDISERQNLADKHPDIVRQLIILSEQARLDIGDVDITGKNKRRSP